MIFYYLYWYISSKRDFITISLIDVRLAKSAQSCLSKSCRKWRSVCFLDRTFFYEPKWNRWVRNAAATKWTLISWSKCWPIHWEPGVNKWHFHSVQHLCFYRTKPSPFFFSHLILTHQLSVTSWDFVNIQQPNEKSSFSALFFSLSLEICTHNFSNMFCICKWIVEWHHVVASNQIGLWSLRIFLLRSWNSKIYIFIDFSRL